MNLYKFQKILSIIPYYSTVFIYVVSMIKLFFLKSTLKTWYYSAALFFFPNIAMFISNALFKNHLSSPVSIMICGILFIPVNIGLVALQEKIEKAPK